MLGQPAIQHAGEAIGKERECVSGRLESEADWASYLAPNLRRGGIRAVRTIGIVRRSPRSRLPATRGGRIGNELKHMDRARRYHNSLRKFSSAARLASVHHDKPPLRSIL